MSGCYPKSLPNFPCVLLMANVTFNIVINGTAVFIRVSPIEKCINYRKIIELAGLERVTNKKIVTYNTGEKSGYLHSGQSTELVEGMFFNVVTQITK